MEINDMKISHHGRTINATFYKPEKKESFPLVIFSHGYNGSKLDFDISARYFAASGIGALCFDFCGGSVQDTSGFPTTNMTLFTEKEDLIAIIEKMKNTEGVQSDKIYLFGGSQGGMVSAMTAEERQGDVAGLILLYPALCIADDWNQKFPNIEDMPEEYDFWGMKLGRGYCETIHDFDVKKEIGKYASNVLIMHGENDQIVPVSYSKWAAICYKNASLEVFVGEEHGFSEEGNRRMEAMALYFIHENLYK